MGQHHQEIALLFTDTMMPGSMNGLELAQLLRKEKPSLKIISSSGYSGDLAMEDGEEIAYLPKPFTPRFFGEDRSSLPGQNLIAPRTDTGHNPVGGR